MSATSSETGSTTSSDGSVSSSSSESSSEGSRQDLSSRQVKLQNNKMFMATGCQCDLNFQAGFSFQTSSYHFFTLVSQHDVINAMMQGRGGGHSAERFPPKTQKLRPSQEPLTIPSD